MTKNFVFHYNEEQDVDGVIFDTVEYPHKKTIQHEVAFSSDTQWDNIILEFARFLDGVGYVGVLERVQSYIDGYWEPVYKLAEQDDEDTSNPGCSD